MSSPTRFAGLTALAVARDIPLSAYLELTYRCNWRCGFCYHARHEDVSPLSVAEWEAVLDDLRELGTLTVTFTGGEVLVHPGFLSIAKAARDRAFLVRVLTNGSLVTDEAAERLAALRPLSVEMSIHGATAGSHDEATATPGSFDALWRGVGRLQRLGVPLALKMPVTARNAGEVEAVVELVEGRGLPLRIDTRVMAGLLGDPGPLRFRAPAGAVERVLALMRSRGAVRGGLLRREGTNCALGTGTMAIDPEGNVFPCLAWRATSLGNVRRQRLAQLWRTSPERAAAAAVARDADRMLREAGGALASYPFCPARAFREGGHPLAVTEAHRHEAENAARLREAGAGGDGGPP